MNVGTKELAKIEDRGKTGERSSPLHGGSKPPPYNLPGILNEQKLIPRVHTKEPAKMEVRWQVRYFLYKPYLRGLPPSFATQNPPPSRMEANIPGILWGIFRVVEGADPYEYTLNFAWTRICYKCLHERACENGG